MNSKSKNTKDLLRLFRKYNKLQDKKYYEKQIIKLEKPIPYGWIFTIVLREDFARSKNGAFYQELINIGYNNYRFTNDVRQIKAYRQGLTALKLKNYVINLFPAQGELSVKQFESLNARYKKYFTYYSGSRFCREHYYLNLPRHYFKLQAKTNYVKEIYDLDKELESELKKLNNKLIKEAFFNKYYGHHKCYPMINDRNRIKTKIKKYLSGNLDDIDNEKIPKDCYY